MQFLFLSSSSRFPLFDVMVLGTSLRWLMGRLIIILVLELLKLLKSSWVVWACSSSHLHSLKNQQEITSRNDFALTGTIITKLVGCLIQLVKRLTRIKTKKVERSSAHELREKSTGSSSLVCWMMADIYRWEAHQQSPISTCSHQELPAQKTILGKESRKLTTVLEWSWDKSDFISDS